MHCRMPERENGNPSKSLLCGKRMDLHKSLKNKHTQTSSEMLQKIEKILQRVLDR